MAPKTKIAFLALILFQGAHSLEEYTHRLWETLAPARFISGLVSSDLATGFAIVNMSIFLFGIWCFFFRVLPECAGAYGLIVFWIVLESLNGIGHPLIALAAGGYRPGVATAPFLLVTAIYLATTLRERPERPAG